MDSNLNLSNPNTFIIQHKSQIHEITSIFKDIQDRIKTDITLDSFLTQLESIGGIPPESIEPIKSFLNKYTNENKNHIFDSIKSNLSKQLDEINNFLYSNCTEVNGSSPNVEIIEEPFDSKLNEQVELKLKGITTLTEDVLKLNEDRKQIYMKSNLDFFTKNNMPPFNYQHTIVLQNNANENKKVNSESLIKSIVDKKENAALKNITDNIKEYKHIMNMQEDLFNEYKKIESDFIKQINDFNCFENASGLNKKEKMLIEENILF